MKKNRRLMIIAGLLLFMMEVTRSQTVTINLDSVYQTIEGFGAFCPGAVNTMTNGTSMTTSQAYNLIVNDLGASLVRINLDPSYLASEGGSYNITSASVMGTPPIEDIFNDVIALKALGLNRYFATVWSPPAWMKYNNNADCTNSATTNLSDGIGPTSNFVDGLVGTAGSLPNYYPNYAQYLLHFIQQFKSYTGVNLYGIGLQNEPAFCEFYCSSILNGPQWRDLISVVGPVLDSAAVPTKIIGPEDMGSMTTEQKYFTPIFEETNKYTTVSRKDLGIYAVHGYLDGVAPDLGNAPGWTSMYNVCHSYGKELWMTETSGYWGTIWENGSDTTSWAYNQAMYLALKYGRVSARAWWALADPNPDQYSLIYGSSPSKTYYVCKQYYRYVRPGAVQVLSSSSDSTILPLAFWNGAQSLFTIVLSNNSSISKTVTLNMTNLPAPFNVYQSSSTESAETLANVTGSSVSLPAYSITTLYYQGTKKAPAIAFVDDTTILMNTTLNLTLTHISDGNNDNDAMAYTVTSASSNTGKIPNGTPVKVNDSTYKLTLTPATDSIGTVQMKAMVTNTSTTDIFNRAFVYFNVTIIPYINTAPNINPISNVTAGMNETGKMQTINLSGINNGSHTTETNTVTASSSNASVVRSLKVNYTGGSSGTITFYPLALGTDTVTVTVTNNGGTALGGSNTTVVKFTITVVSVVNGIEETKAINDLEVYPNPATDYIHIVIPDNNVKTLAITDVTGRIVLEESITSDQLTVNVSELPSGIYIIIAKGDDKVYKSRVTIK
jgi:O-glycosyl hydrolase